MNGVGLLVLRALRLIRRSPVRSVATGALVALAVLGGSVWLSEARGHYERDSSRDALLGAADVRYNLFSDAHLQDGDTLAEPADQLAGQIDTVVAALPEGTDTAVVESFNDAWVGSARQYDIVSIHQAPWNEPLLDGMVDLLDGQLPGPGEVVVSPSLAVSLGVDLGDRLVVRRPVAVLDVVGLGTTGSTPQLVVDEGEFFGPADVDLAALDAGNWAAVLAGLPPGAVAPEIPLGGSPPDQLVARPLTEGSFPANPPTGTSTGAVLVVVLFVGATAGAAFGIGAIRRRRALGLLAANGATGHQLRLAAGAEALVVSLPAAAFGALAAAALPPVWVRLRLPRWDLAWQYVVPLQWVALLATASVAAAVVGAMAFSRSATTAPVSQLLEGPRAARDGTARWGRHALVLLVVITAVVALLRGAAVAELVALAVVLGVWCAAAAALVAAARHLLSRHAIGRLVGRDLARRPLGALAAVLIIAMWSLFAVMWILSPNLGGFDRSGSFVDPLPGTAVSSTPPHTGTEHPSTVTVRPALPTSLRQSSAASSAVRTSELPAGLQAELAELGLATRPAIVGEYLGPCDVCPDGYRPTVMVLDGTEGLDLPDETAAALEGGSVVTGFSVANVDEATVSELPIVVADLPLQVSAAMLRAFAPEDTELDRPTEVLVGSTDGLSDLAAVEVVTAIAEAGAEAVTADRRLAPFGVLDAREVGDGAADTRSTWGWLVAVVVPALVALAATVAYRREHADAAHVLWLLGAAPNRIRRLSGITAGSLAGVGVLIGTSSAAVVVATMIASRSDLGVGDVVGLSEALAILAILVAVPTNAKVVAGLRPARTSPPDPAPA